MLQTLAPPQVSRLPNDSLNGVRRKFPTLIGSLQPVKTSWQSSNTETSLQNECDYVAVSQRPRIATISSCSMIPDNSRPSILLNQYLQLVKVSLLTLEIFSPQNKSMVYNKEVGFILAMDEMDYLNLQPSVTSSLRRIPDFLWQKSSSPAARALSAVILL